MSEIAESFASSLSELTVNSKPHINMLTMLAEDHLEFAPIITQTVLTHLQKVRPEVKLPVLYLIDSIVKNVGKTYVNLFTQSIVQNFTSTFEKVDEKTREQMFKLRQTWSDVFPAKTIYSLDAKVHGIDPAWPITAPPSTVHLNPKFFKPGMCDPKSLTSTIKQPAVPQNEVRSRHRKNKSYNPRTSSVTHSSQSKKASSASTTSKDNTLGTKATPAPEQLREQMILKQKMLLELQQQKLKLELMQTQAQLEEQQKQLEKQSMNHKASSELTKLQKIVSQEEAKLKLMSKNLKRQVRSKFPNLQQIHRTTNEMKGQKAVDITKMSVLPSTLVKPAALLELNKEDINIKPSKPPAVIKPAVPKESKPKMIPQLQHSVEKQKPVTATDSAEEAPPPVRIAPVSSQLINAALSFGRNVRDPRIRQMSSRLESQLNTTTVQAQPTPTPTPASAPAPASAPPPSTVPEKKSDHIHSKSKKDKKPNSYHHKERSVKISEEENKSHHRTSGRSSDRSSGKHSGKTEKSPPSKKSEEKTDRKSKVEDLFTHSRSKSPVQVQSVPSTHSPSKSHSKHDQTKSVEVIDPLIKTSHIERSSNIESSPKRTKLQDSWQGTQSNDYTSDTGCMKQLQNLTLDIAKAQSIKQSETPKSKISPDPIDSSAEMLYEDIEKIVKHPDIVSKINKLPEVKVKNEDSQELSKSSDNSSEERFDQIVKHPIKLTKLDTTNEDKLKISKPMSFEMPDEKLNQLEVGVDLNSGVSSASSTGTENAHKARIMGDTNTQLLGLEKLFSKPDESVNYKVSQQFIPYSSKDPRMFSHSHKNENILEFDQSKCVNEDLMKQEYETLNELSNQEEDSSIVNCVSDSKKNIMDTLIEEKIISTEITASEFEEYIPSNMESHLSGFELKEDKSVYVVSYIPDEEPGSSDITDSLSIVKPSERLTLSPRNIQSPVKNVEPMETIQETNENVTPDKGFSSPKMSDRQQDSPVNEEKKNHKGDKLSMMEQMIADAEKQEASPSPPPPPIISDKFKEIKQSSLSRLRRVGRSREDVEDSESPERTPDVDLRTQIQQLPLNKDQKNEILGLPDKDVDLRHTLTASPTKKRPSMEKLLDIPPAKKSKEEIMENCAREVAKTSMFKIRYFPARPDSTHWYNNARLFYYKRLFGSEDVDLRQQVFCPPPPSPPPPPVISTSPPPDSAGEKLWARYKQTKPDTYKAKYTPSRRDRAPSTDKFGRSPRFINVEGSGGWQGRGGRSTSQKDIDMRAQPPSGPDGSYNQIIMQAFEQHKRGDLNYDAYTRVISEVFAMREKHQLEEAQRRDEAETAQAEHLEPISDDEISGGSLSGVEDAPSPTTSYSGADDVEDSCLKKSPTDEEQKTTSNEEQVDKVPDNLVDVNSRIPPTDVDIRVQMDDQPLMDLDEKPTEDIPIRKSRGVSPPYSRNSSDLEKERYRSRREELKTQRREKKSRRLEDERGPRYRKPRFGQEPWNSNEGRNIPPSESMDIDTPRVPPVIHYEDGMNFREPPPVTVHPARFDKDFLPEQHDSPPMRPTPWDPTRMPGPNHWVPGMPPIIRGPPVMGIRPQDRFIPPRWHQPAPIFEGDPSSRFNRFGPPPLGRFPGPPPPCEVPPTDPAVVKLIEEDPTKSINIDGVPRDIRFYGLIAVAFMSWDDPREVSFQPGQRRLIINDRDSLVVHFNTPPLEMLIDGKPHRVRFGGPTRELYIDNQWYEVFFGGPPVTCDIGGKPYSIQLEGPPPPVRTGVHRKDLVVGKITLIIDAEYFFTVYLDAKPQKFEVKGVPYIIRFVEALQKTVINGIPFKSDFGGLPRPIILNGSKHFFRLTALPRGVTPGFITIVNMEGGRMPSPPTLPAPPQLPASLEKAVDMKGDTFLQPPMSIPPPVVSPEIPKRDMEVPVMHPPTLPLLVTSAPQLTQPPPAIVNPLDMLTNMMPVPEPSRPVDYSYSVENENSNQTAAVVTSTVTTTTSTAPTLTGEINVTELLQKLMATGIVPILDQSKDKHQEKPITTESGLIKPVDFRKPETLKIRQTALVSHLYSGIQCNSCGVRFPPEQTMKYSQHLDWHFRQNRRDKDSSRTAQTRRYYYDVNDWVQFEEIEDLEERAQPWFEMQEGGVEEDQVPQVFVSVPAANYPEDAVCHICHDKFESFYNEEKEEWHLRNSVDNDGKLVHPLCLEDQRVAAEKPIVVEDIDITEDEPKEEEVQEKKEEEPPKVELDDDIMEVTDIEFVKPVFPVEDLTVSDSESVVDNNEDKPKIEEEAKEEIEKMNVDEPCEITVPSEVTIPSEIKDDVEEGEKELPEKMEPETKDEDTQDDLVVLEKEEDSGISKSDITEVVRNIKKDPDSLGGEYEEIGLDPDIEIKKEKGEVPLPAPVVDTTHATVNCLIDGNVEFEEPPQQINVGGPPKIKINITKTIVQPTCKEPKESEPEVPDPETANSTFPPPTLLVSQPLPPGEEPVPTYVKPKLIGRKLQELPSVLKGTEMSGLCSIM